MFLHLIEPAHRLPLHYNGQADGALTVIRMESCRLHWILIRSNSRQRLAVCRRQESLDATLEIYINLHKTYPWRIRVIIVIYRRRRKRSNARDRRHQRGVRRRV